MSSVNPTLMSDTTYQTETPQFTETNEFHYRPMSPLGPISALLGLIALTAFVGWPGICVAGVALAVTAFGVRSIGRSEGAVGGLGMAQFGLVLSVASLVGGSALLTYNYNTECPEGYERVNFPRQIASKMFNMSPTGMRTIPEEVEPFLDRPVFLKGYMYKTKSTANLRDFVILKDSGECCFGGDPKAYDMIQVTLNEDLDAVNFPAFSMVAVAGVLKADPTAPQGAAVYTMEAHQCESARTSF